MVLLLVPCRHLSWSYVVCCWLFVLVGNFLSGSRRIIKTICGSFWQILYLHLLRQHSDRGGHRVQDTGPNHWPQMYVCLRWPPSCVMSCPVLSCPFLSSPDPFHPVSGFAVLSFFLSLATTLWPSPVVVVVCMLVVVSPRNPHSVPTATVAAVATAQQWGTIWGDGLLSGFLGGIGRWSVDSFHGVMTAGNCIR